MVIKGSLRRAEETQKKFTILHKTDSEKPSKDQKKKLFLLYRKPLVKQKNWMPMKFLCEMVNDFRLLKKN